MPVSFKTTKAEQAGIGRIVDRACRDGRTNFATDEDAERLEMDLSACIAQGIALDLERLLAADNFNFWHDVGGITNCMDRHTGKLRNHFLPRFYRPKLNRLSARERPYWRKRYAEERAHA